MLTKTLLLMLKLLIINNMQPTIASSAPNVRKRGWHAKESPSSPHHGKGSATVSPIRDLKEIARIKGALAEKPRDLSLFVIGIHLGLRGSDLLKLRWADVIDSTGKISEKITVREEKTKNTRHIAIQEKARQSLENWRRCSNKTVNPDNYIWPSRGGRALTIQRLHQLVNSWCMSAGLTGNYGTHTLRKTYGYHLRRLGYDIDLLMKIFGHSSASITLRYIGVEQEQIDEANLRLSL